MDIAVLLIIVFTAFLLKLFSHNFILDCAPLRRQQIVTCIIFISYCVPVPPATMVALPADKINFLVASKKALAGLMAAANIASV